ncbi:hypothetical protein V1478_003727 [Vespula squamosa]|uniref:Uncharacterized protein n=1 Tax=Vespula squamosa TaxID=30214 RepID=A0ABD2BMM8_VESSQ
MATVMFVKRGEGMEWDRKDGLSTITHEHSLHRHLPLHALTIVMLLGKALRKVKTEYTYRSLAKMKLTNFLVILMLVILAVCAHAAPKRRGFPQFPGYGTFNPKGNLPVPFPKF